ncbi:uracil-DNA glycosylase [Erysipelothrix larvae]|uniref:Uracil-DNA glycosylase n=1 Tax=Erysipelothrix larvae TaxID=1514105 RepID=A0A109UHQ5_9FIRM|nr:uracil-DNA glycosylase family protein [Erysipelothrix larvae]AMC94558.1 uracil-DNA glycosylase [Erysipelothrix larvae]
MNAIDAIKENIKHDPENLRYTQQDYNPIFMAHPDARILLVGQAPGLKTQLKNDVFRDRSGDRLRAWLGVDEDTFYNSHLFAVLPMDFYFPGSKKTGDLPPRKGFAQKWHPQLLACMPYIQLIILIGQYAQKYYLKDTIKPTLTQTVRAYQSYTPKYFPIVHPSPLNQRWLSKNPFFEHDVIPLLQEMVSKIINA